MPDSPYNQVRYPTFPRIVTHPDRLAAVGTLFGMAPRPVAGCRVLEIGCGDANNLISMAYALPGSHFTGVDLAAERLEAGRNVAECLDLQNVTLAAQDLGSIGPEFGEFDYILAHGVYSWVPEEVRDRLMAVCRERLAPEGIALISYNTLPGRCVRQMLREMLLDHTREIAEPAARIEQARRFLRFFLESRTMASEWNPIVDQEAQAMLERECGAFYHDDLAPVSDAFYFREFAAHASRHGLQYLGEAEPHEMIDHRGSLGWVGDDFLAREQYLDYLKARRFRETLLCHETVKLDREPAPGIMERFCFSSAGRGVEVKAADEAVLRVAHALEDIYPLPAAFADLVPYAGNPESLREILFTLVRGGFADLHVYDFPCADSVSRQPRASALARLQAETSGQVSNLCQLTVELDGTARALIRLADGTRTVDEIAAQAEISPEDARAALAWMASVALLED